MIQYGQQTLLHRACFMVVVALLLLARDAAEVTGHEHTPLDAAH